MTLQMFLLIFFFQPTHRGHFSSSAVTFSQNPLPSSHLFLIVVVSFTGIYLLQKQTSPLLVTRNGSERQLWRKSFLSENRYSFSSNHYCTLALMCFRFVCLFYLFFIFIYSIIVLRCLREQQGYVRCHCGWAFISGCFYLALWSILHEFVSLQVDSYLLGSSFVS